MPLSFADNVPHWMRRMTRRWVRVLGYEDWTIEIRRASEEEIQEFTGSRAEEAASILGATYPQPQYLTGEILLSEDLQRADAEPVIIHELLHLHLAPFTLLLEQMWDGRRRIEREAARGMLAALIEERIERHVRQLQRARGKG